jgi:hypothetical protein
VIVDLGQQEALGVTDIALDPQRRLLALVGVGDVYRFSTTGGQDFQFGSLGRASTTVTDFGVPVGAAYSSITSDAQSRILVGGLAVLNGVHHSLASRLSSGGVADPSYGDGQHGAGNFVMRLPAGSGFEQASVVRMQGDRTLLAGRTNYSNGQNNVYHQMVYGLAGDLILSDGFE